MTRAPKMGSESISNFWLCDVTRLCSFITLIRSYCSFYQAVNSKRPNVPALARSTSVMDENGEVIKCASAFEMLSSIVRVLMEMCYLSRRNVIRKVYIRKFILMQPSIHYTLCVVKCCIAKRSCFLSDTAGAATVCVFLNLNRNLSTLSVFPSASVTTYLSSSPLHITVGQYRRTW